MSKLPVKIDYSCMASLIKLMRLEIDKMEEMFDDAYSESIGQMPCRRKKAERRFAKKIFEATKGEGPE